MAYLEHRRCRLYHISYSDFNSNRKQGEIVFHLCSSAAGHPIPLASNSAIGLSLIHIWVFNDILRLEEASLRQSCGNLSVTELHVLDAVSHCAPQCGMADIAAALKVTAGTATVAVKTLEQKGYVVRTRHEKDKRLSLIHI